MVQDRDPLMGILFLLTMRAFKIGMAHHFQIKVNLTKSAEKIDQIKMRKKLRETFLGCLQLRRNWESLLVKVALMTPN